MPVLPLGVQSLHVLQGIVGGSGEVRISCGEQVKHAGVEIDVLNLQLLSALPGGAFEGEHPSLGFDPRLLLKAGLLEAQHGQLKMSLLVDAF